MQPNLKRAVGYYRVSTKEQVEEGNSLSTQEKLCKEWVRKNGYEIIEQFIEQGESAKTADRTELQKLFIYCANKKNMVDAVVIYKLDRLSRNTDDYSQIRLLLKKYGVEIKSTTEFFENTPVGRFMENTMANIAQFDNDIRSERSGGGMKEAVRDGRYVWMAPVGYINTKVNGKSTIAQDPLMAPIVRETFELALKGIRTVEEVRVIMEERGLALKSGKPLNKTYFYKILKNKLYMGTIEKFGEIHKGLFEPIVSEELFNQVQRILRGKGRKEVQYKKDNDDFPLRRFVLSEEGKKVTGSFSKGRQGVRYPFYRFGNKGSNYNRDRFEEQYKEYIDSFSFTEEQRKKLEAKNCNQTPFRLSRFRWYLQKRRKN
jgi:DNA invertase Pin-like site-specific DNA recombinase